jgi:hypothetical protein
MFNSIPPEIVEFHRTNEHLRPGPITPLKTPSYQAVIHHPDIPYLPLKLPFAVPHAEMLAEAKKLEHCYVQHREGEIHAGWKSLCIHGISSVHIKHAEAYGYDPETAPYRWTDIANLCPVTTSFFKDLFRYRVYHRVRFMMLEPGGYVGPHTDMAKRKLSSINLALNNPEGCQFVLEGQGVIPFEPGSANMLGLYRRHSVWNDSIEPRFHIIIHGARDFTSHWVPTTIHSYEALRNG